MAQFKGEPKPQTHREAIRNPAMDLSATAKLVKPKAQSPFVLHWTLLICISMKNCLHYYEFSAIIEH